MTRISDSTRQARLDRVLMLLKQREALSEAEIAQHLNLERRTVNNYLRELEFEAKVEKDGIYWRLSTLRPVVPRKLELEPEQAVLLYLAMRMLVKQSDRRIETAETLLLQLAAILQEDIGLGDYLVQAARELAERPVETEHEDILRTIARAAIHQRKVRLVYHSYKGKPFETIFCSYILEPSAMGFATYVIGFSSAAGAMRTYKVERIQSAELLRETFVIPDTFKGLELLRNSWSIYYGDEVTPVVLRFHPSVARRVQETHWRTASAPEPDPEMPDYVRLTLHVADTTDLKPWIRTWGANVEILAPAELREEMIEEVRTAAQLYGWYVGSQPATPDDPFGLNDTFSDMFRKTEKP